MYGIFQVVYIHTKINYTHKQTTEGTGKDAPRPKYHAVKTCRGKEEEKLHTFLTLALDGGESLASSSGCFTPTESSLVLTERKVGGLQS
jgi:hypothetical protein